MGLPRRLRTVGRDSGPEGGPLRMQQAEENKNEENQIKYEPGVANPFAKGGLQRSPPQQNREQAETGDQVQASRQKQQKLLEEQQVTPSSALIRMLTLQTSVSTPQVT